MSYQCTRSFNTHSVVIPATFSSTQLVVQLKATTTKKWYGIFYVRPLCDQFFCCPLTAVPLDSASSSSLSSESLSSLSESLELKQTEHSTVCICKELTSVQRDSRTSTWFDLQSCRLLPFSLLTTSLQCRYFYANSSYAVTQGKCKSAGTKQSTRM